MDYTQKLFVLNPRNLMCTTVVGDEHNLNRAYAFGCQIKQGVYSHVIIKIVDPPLHYFQSLSVFNLKTNQLRRLSFDF